MASTKTVSKGIRITNEADEYYRHKPLNRIVEGLIPLFESGKLEFDGEGVKICGDMGAHTQNKGDYTDVLADIESMALCFGLTLEEMTGQFCEMLNDGSLTVEGGVLQPVEEGWIENFRETCHDLCIPVEKAGESAVKALRKGQI